MFTVPTENQLHVSTLVASSPEPFPVQLWRSVRESMGYELIQRLCLKHGVVEPLHPTYGTERHTLHVYVLSPEEYEAAIKKAYMAGFEDGIRSSKP